VPVGPEGPDLTAAVLAWGVPQLRDLPWRRTRDPWAVLVSEVMLQQTGVHRVVPKWHTFLEAFPTPPACAAAPLGDVLRLWQGLGYPRRARNLQAAAAVTVDRHDGNVPATLDDLLALPGIGPYTARAVLAFAFETDVAVVDTNIARIFARVAGTRLTPSQVQRDADAALEIGESWTWNQALMDLGATVCTARSPQCAVCPISHLCSWRRADNPEPDPAQGSAGVSGPQARFDGSDRQARGRLMKALGHSPVPVGDAASRMGLAEQPERAGRLIAALVGEGLVVEAFGNLNLP
jgi:A/G-specific adenine glycosylase